MKQLLFGFRLIRNILQNLSCHVVSHYHHGSFDIPRTERCRHDVIVSTIASSGYLVSRSMEGHFSHVIIDEAGQCMLHESLIPISLVNENTVLVMVGDPKQLGPIIRYVLCLLFCVLFDMKEYGYDYAYDYYYDYNHDMTMAKSVNIILSMFHNITDHYSTECFHNRVSLCNARVVYNNTLND